MASVYRIVIVGEGGVGKSALTIKLISNYFVEEYDPIIEDSYRKAVVIDNESCVLDILDTAEQAEYSAMKDEYMRTAQGFLCVYSIDCNHSFSQINKFRQSILTIKQCDKIPIVLIANKCDLLDDRQVSKIDGQALAKRFGVPFFETSAKTNTNIEQSFYELVREIRYSELIQQKQKLKQQSCIIF
eukprot:TRINITY_DN1542_c0_g3_i1.p1 TRINITY_DN1542_c0_g3~~TRINITY_DN1542_c0_g3_i1.p1  ORF type:complete len:186 (-),score=54.19 TRINITY_DN1542_c0_g3_i1:113-670(-)